MQYNIGMKKMIKDFPNYEIDDQGNVRNVNTNHFVTKRLIRNYHYVDLRYNGKRKNARLGRLVAQIFLENPENKPQVNHLDGNQLNDCLKNLEWCTVSENQVHKNNLARLKGIYKKPKGNRKFSIKKIEKVHELRKKGMLHKEIAKKLNMGISTVTHILLGNRRKLQE